MQENSPKLEMSVSVVPWPALCDAQMLAASMIQISCHEFPGRKLKNSPFSIIFIVIVMCYTMHMPNPSFLCIAEVPSQTDSPVSEGVSKAPKTLCLEIYDTFPCGTRCARLSHPCSHSPLCLIDLGKFIGIVFSHTDKTIFEQFVLSGIECFTFAFGFL